jgi:hypothetical protein
LLAEVVLVVGDSAGLAVVVVVSAGLLDSVVSLALVAEAPLPLTAVEDAERESVTYQPLPLKTMPTGWNTLRKLPPHCSQVVRGASEKLWRLSMTSLQDVQV